MSLVLITGGARGIGKHLAAGFATAGYTVVLTATTAKAAQAAAEELSVTAGGQAFGLSANVADPSSVASLATRIGEIEGETGQGLGVVINNAGVIEAPEGPVWNVPAAQLERTITTNVLGPFYMVREFAPMLIERAAQTGRPGRIIDLNSGSGSTGSPQYAAYSASKVALFRLADSVHEYGFEHGLRIFELAPGVVASDMTVNMPVHKWRGADDWTEPTAVINLALALASGDLDELSGRFVRAGADTPETLRARVQAGIDANFRRLTLDLDG